jgi:predicted nucleic acid-binding protein
MGLLIDTGVLIRIERSAATLDFSPWASYGDAAISVVSASAIA